ncbi:hypothetical protein NPX13_g10996 [Xylaria arbuscula]|uniref:HAT C-terminal dimerisation domain-containing protein n=1 Tax=Xylaria arbuscula TaxID=114810 RepID=A0A9W8N3M9_9PEZI|nr:hypothetical protein NPX13_g10996 [Xylaria arbuscula]
MAPKIAAIDELETYLQEPPVDIDHYMRDPLVWWRDIGQKRFPQLSIMASDFLSIPSSTAETERQFNSTGDMISVRRTRLRRHVIGAAQCIRSWSKRGIYEPALPLSLLDRQDWEQQVDQIARILHSE